jgi:hypothetical protein
MLKYLDSDNGMIIFSYLVLAILISHTTNTNIISNSLIK